MSIESLEQPLNEVLEDGDTCSASITIVKQESVYSYIPILNCGDAYTTRSLVDKILADNQVVTQDSGLYNENGEHFFRGKVANNYVAYGSYEVKDETTPFLWRIVSIKDNEIKLKAMDKQTKKLLNIIGVQLLLPIPNHLKRVVTSTALYMYYLKSMIFYLLSY